MNKQISKIVQIPTNATIVQMEVALNNYLNTGYELIQIFVLNTNTYAVLKKNVAS